MSKFKVNPSVLDNLARGDKVDLSLSDDDILALLEVLSFAYEASKFVLEVENEKGTPAGAEKIRKHMRNSERLLVRVYGAIATAGRPDEADLN